MTTQIKTLLAIATIVTGTTLLAQPAQPSVSDEQFQGVIGKRHAEAGLGLQDVTEVDDVTYVAEVGGNLPLTSFLDLSARYSHRWAEGHDDLSSDIFEGSATWYKVIDDGVKPFLSGAVGYRTDNFQTDTSLRTIPDTSYGIWSVTAGTEFPYELISVTPTITYSDDFRNSQDSKQSLDYGVRIDSWATERVGVYLKVVYADSWRSNSNSWYLGAGVRVRL
jgi:hypothetical protein